MVKPENIEPSLPEVDPITNDQEAQIDDFLQHVEKAFPDGLPLLLTREESTERQRMLAYRFLKARKWKLADALTMFMKTVAYRTEMQIDSWRLFPCAFPILGYDITKLMELADRIAPNPTKYPRSTSESFDACYRALQASYVNLYHFWDKEGHPVLYDGFGKTHAKQVIRDLKAATPPGKSLKDIVLPYHVYMNEVQYYLIRHADELSRSQGRRAITGITVILDAQGLHFGLLNRQFIDVVRKIFALDQDYYPEVLHRLFVINAPYLLTVAYNRVKGSLDVHTRNKVVFCGEKETPAVLQRVIDFDHLPMELGGHCNCPGGCLPRYIRPDISGPDDSMDEARTEEFTIKAGKKVHKPFPIEAGMEFSWEFAMSSEDTDIRFSIIFDAEGKGATALQVKADKSDADDGSYLAPSKGIVTITFDNSSSWISAKTVLLRAGVGNPSSDDIQTAVS